MVVCSMLPRCRLNSLSSSPRKMTGNEGRAELEQQMREEAAIERRWDLQRQGIAPVSVDERLSTQAAAEIRNDRREESRIKHAEAEMARPPARKLDRWEVKKTVAEREAAKETTPATKGDIGWLEGAVSHMEALLHAATGKTFL